MARRTLKLTSPLMSGSDVTDFQKLVTSKGFSCGAIDGKYGKKSVSACKKFQASVGLSADGICGIKTWGKLETKTRHTLKLTSPMMKGEDVKEFQTKVTKHGFNCGTIDSIYGQKAKAACVAFQKAKGLSADGICGAKTWAALDGAVSPAKPSAPSSGGSTKITEMSLRQKVVNEAKKYLGCKESDGSHKVIIDGYNAHKPLARNYRMKYTGSWCATFVSFVAIQCGLTDIMPTECSCGKMIELYKKIGRWEENDAYVPKIGDILMYDWDDNGKGDDTGWPEHVGIVVEVSGNNMKIIEGNKSDAVGYRNVEINGRFIRGFCLPNYGSKVK